MPRHLGLCFFALMVLWPLRAKAFEPDLASCVTSDGGCGALDLSPSDQGDTQARTDMPWHGGGDDPYYGDESGCAFVAGAARTGPAPASVCTILIGVLLVWLARRRRLAILLLLFWLPHGPPLGKLAD